MAPPVSTLPDDPILRGLNDAQRAAVEAVAGPLLILAGPGSGKTRVISHRVAYLIRTWGISPRRIMTVTFTNKAARELRERIERLVGSAIEQLTAGTFHSICARILRIEGERIKVDRRFLIYDDDDQIRLMKQVLEELRLDETKISPRAVLSAISRLKAELIGPDETSWRSRGDFDDLVRRAYRLYQTRLSESRALDFDDLLGETVHLFQECPDVLERYQERYVHLMVDEFQDTNVVQYVLVKLLAGKHRNLAVVGDPDQSIYRFRSADIRNILDFERDFADAKIVYLEQNYRSTQNILDGAQAMILANRQRKPKELWTENGQGQPITVREHLNEVEEARSVAQDVEKLVDSGQRAYRDFAVMYRTNAQSRSFEQMFVTHGIPYRLVGGTRFYERREVKDLLAYLRLIANPQDTVSVARIINVPTRGIGQKTIDDLTRYARALGLPFFEALQTLGRGGDAGLAPRAEQAVAGFVRIIEDLGQAVLPLPALLQLLIDRTAFRDYLQVNTPEGAERWENVQQLIAATGEYADLEPGDALARFLEEVALFTDLDSQDNSADAVTLITLHAAKGLEYPLVFIVGLEEGILPHSRSILGTDGDEVDEALEEERRLFYVGMTRAQEQLYLLRAYRRNYWGRNQPLPASRFLRDIPAKVRTKDQVVLTQRPTSLPPRPGLPERRPAPTVPSDSFVAGDRVRQLVFGEGIVISVTAVPNDLEVTVAFREARVGVKRLLQSLARLEKVVRA